MRFAFWNTNNTSGINPYISSIIEDCRIDCFILTEYSAEQEDLISLVNKQNFHSLETEVFGSSKITIFGDNILFSPGPQNYHYSIQIIDEQFIICAAHLMSNMSGDRFAERRMIFEEIKREIVTLSEKKGIKKYAIVGDLNENPYDRNCYAADSLHALSSVRESMRKERTIDGKQYATLYNPMWRLLGDNDGPPGTYFLKNAVIDNQFWYMLDQVIISPEAINDFVFDELKIITYTSYGSLEDTKHRPNRKISDHYPILFEMKGV